MFSEIIFRLNITMLQCSDFILTWKEFESIFKEKYLRKESFDNLKIL